MKVLNFSVKKTYNNEVNTLGDFQKKSWRQFSLLDNPGYFIIQKINVQKTFTFATTTFEVMSPRFQSCVLISA